MSLSVILLSTFTVVLTSVVPLAIFFLLGPFLFKSKHQSLALPLLVSLAAGSLLGDVFFHLIPEIFDLKIDYLGKCMFMLVGVFIFLVGERLLQQYHQGHGHSHLTANNSETQFSMVGAEDGCEEIELDVVSDNQATSGASPNLPTAVPTDDRSSQGHKPVGLLVLTSDFVHNFVDGIAIGVSFSTSMSVGISTSVAVFLHEIPHELGDFAILLNAGFKPTTIVVCNVLTALSSLFGVLVSVCILRLHGEGSGVDPTAEIDKFSRTIEPMILAITAGNFLYIALADLIPELLHDTGPNHHCQQTDSEGQPSLYSHRFVSLVQYLSFLVGAMAMFVIKVYSD